MLNSLKLHLVLILALNLLLSSGAYAQLESETIVGVRVFHIDYFDEFDPVNAMDMVNKTPGFNPQSQSDGRGLSGVRSNLLINGERPPPKGQTAQQQLNDIPYTNVSRIELIDTSSSQDLDMQGYSRVVNVILEDDRSDYYELVTNYQKTGTGNVNQRNQSRLQFEGTTLFSLGDHEFNLRAGTNDLRNRNLANLVNINPVNPVQRLSSPNNFKRDDQFLQLGSIFDLGIDSALTINAEISADERSVTPILLSTDPNLSTSINQVSKSKDDMQEISAEYRRPLGIRSDFLFAVVDSLSTDESESSLSLNGLLRSSLTNRESGETAARFLFTHKFDDQLTIRTTATTAFNYFEGSFQFFENGIALPISGNNSRVEEDRHALGVEVDWNWNEKWLFRGNASVGVYNIDANQSSSGEQDESKGFVSAAYQLQERTTLTYESKREIGQLSFGQFLASSNLSSDIIQAGAASLEPESSWKHSLTYDQRFGDKGVLTFELSHLNVENPVHSVALSDSLIVSQNTFAEKVNRFEASLDYPFEKIGQEDLVFEFSASLSDSETIDPISREIHEVPNINPYHWSVGLRRNPGEGKWSWGFNFFTFANNDRYNVREIREQSNNRQSQAFLEWEIIEGLKLRGQLENSRSNSEVQTFFPSVRQVGLAPSFVATSTQTRDKSASISLEWRGTDHLEVTASIRTQPRNQTIEHLRAFGATSGTTLSREIAETPRIQLEFRLYR